jgi:hypothetical protein
MHLKKTLGTHDYIVCSFIRINVNRCKLKTFRMFAQLKLIKNITYYVAL